MLQHCKLVRLSLAVIYTLLQYFRARLELTLRVEPITRLLCKKLAVKNALVYKTTREHLRVYFAFARNKIG
jgi:hypothetical protein